ncbi:MAG: hypothetical protein V3W34_00315 [Phycisphaerae bacterium]
MPDEQQPEKPDEAKPDEAKRDEPSDKPTETETVSLRESGETIQFSRGSSKDKDESKGAE